MRGKNDRDSPALFEPQGPFSPLLGNRTRFLLQKFSSVYATQFCNCGYSKQKKMGKTCSFPRILQFTGASFPSSGPKGEGSLEDLLVCTSCTGLTFGPTLERKGKTQKHIPKWAPFSSLVALLNSLVIVYLSESGSCVLHFEYNLEIGYHGLIPSRCHW